MTQVRVEKYLCARSALFLIFAIPCIFFLYLRLFNSLNRIIGKLKIADDWIQTVDLWCRKQPLYQLYQNHKQFFLSSSNLHYELNDMWKSTTNYTERRSPTFNWIHFQCYTYVCASQNVTLSETWGSTILNRFRDSESITFCDKGLKGVPHLVTKK